MNLIPYPKYKLIDETILDTEWLFSHSMKQNINRADILVRMLAIDNYYQKNDFGFQLYDTMQRPGCVIVDLGICYWIYDFMFAILKK